MKEIAWIVGTSSAGKRTFIKKISTDKGLAKRFGWQDKVVSVCAESVDYVGNIDMPEIVRARKQIPGTAAKLLESSDVVLIKWQYIDSYCESPQRLKELLPHASHRTILLVAPREELEERLNTEDWWQGSWANATALVDDELEMVKKFVDELKQDFEVTTIDSSKHGGYQESST